jgi:hypothetical protein
MRFSAQVRRTLPAGPAELLFVLGHVVPSPNTFALAFFGTDMLGIPIQNGFEAQGCSLMVNHGIEPVKNWWKPRTFAVLPVPEWMKELLNNTQPIRLALQQKIRALTLQLQTSAAPFLFKMSQ